MTTRARQLITLAGGLVMALALAVLFAPQAQAQSSSSSILLPAEGEELCVGDVIAWTTDAGIEGTYRLRIGTEPNGNNVFNRTYPEVSGMDIDVLQEMVPLLPAGEDLYVSLRYKGTEAGASWAFQDSVEYTACASSVIIQSDFADICVGDELTWNAVAPGGKYRLRIGTTADGLDLLNQSTPETELAVEFGDVMEASSVYVTLRYKPAGGSWIIVDEKIFLPCVGPINITAPVGELCTGDEMTWPAIGRSQIRLGTATDTRDIWSGTTWGNTLDVPVVPAGIPIFASLRGQNAEGRWVLYDIVEYEPCSNPIDLSGPAGPTLCSSDELTWTGDADKFRVWIGSSVGDNDMFNDTSTDNSIVAELLPPEGDRYVTLLAKADGVWTTHDEAVFTECGFSIELTSDNGYSDLCPNDPMSTSGPTTGSTRMWIGTAAGLDDIANLSIPSGGGFVIPEQNVSTDGTTVYVSIVYKPVGGEWAVHQETTWDACKQVPTSRDDGPAPGSVVGDDYHLDVGEARTVAVGDSENPLNNDTLGQPFAEISLFDGAAVDTTIVFETSGSIIMQADGSFVVTAPTTDSGSHTFLYVLENSEGTSTASLTIEWGVQE